MIRPDSVPEPILFIWLYRNIRIKSWTAFIRVHPSEDSRLLSSPHDLRSFLELDFIFSSPSSRNWVEGFFFECFCAIIRLIKLDTQRIMMGKTSHRVSAMCVNLTG